MKKKFAIDTFAINIAVSFFFASIFIVLGYFLLDEKINYYTSLINTIAVNSSEDSGEEIVLNYETKRLVTYPDYGKKYATLSIPSIELKLPLYYGDSLKILKYGAGHNAGTYFPGEGGSIIVAAHNTASFFKRLEEVKVDDEITIETSYGTFKYKVDSFKVVKETDLSAFPIQTERELLILYTCYPMNRSVIGRRTERYVVYAYRVGD